MRFLAGLVSLFVVYGVSWAFLNMIVIFGCAMAGVVLPDMTKNWTVEVVAGILTILLAAYTTGYWLENES